MTSLTRESLKGDGLGEGGGPLRERRLVHSMLADIKAQRRRGIGTLTYLLSKELKSIEGKGLRGKRGARLKDGIDSIRHIPTARSSRGKGGDLRRSALIGKTLASSWNILGGKRKEEGGSERKKGKGVDGYFKSERKQGWKEGGEEKSKSGGEEKTNTNGGGGKW